MSMMFRYIDEMDDFRQIICPTMSMMFRYIDEMDDFRQIWKNRS